MELAALSDAELIDLTRGGSAPAFAVLLHRHGPAVRAAVANDPDPTGAVIGTFLRAMRRLDTEPPSPDRLRPWLLELAAKETKDPAPVGDSPLPELDPDERDEIWAELDLRWPNGKVERSIPHWVGWAALVVALVALGVVVPYAAVTWGAEDTGDDDVEVLRAEPFDDEELDQREEAPELVDEDLEAGFELPPLDLDDPQPESEQVAEPEPQPGSEPEPELEAEAGDPEPVDEEPEDSGSEDSGSEDPTEDGSTDDDATDDDATDDDPTDDDPTDDDPTDDDPDDPDDDPDADEPTDDEPAP